MSSYRIVTRSRKRLLAFDQKQDSPPSKKVKIDISTTDDESTDEVPENQPPKVQFKTSDVFDIVDPEPHKQNFDSSLFLNEEVVKTLSCPICLEVCCQGAVFFGCEANHFGCEQCYKENRKNHRCPVCRTHVSETATPKVNRLVPQIIAKLLIYCPNKKKDDSLSCNWVGRVEQLQKHITTCGHCQLKCKTCGLKCLRLEAEFHVSRGKCTFTCSACKATLPNMDNNQRKHEEKCLEVMVECGQHVCCTVMKKRKDMKVHMERECEYRLVSCRFGCKKRIRFSKVKEHEAKYMEKHLEMSHQRCNVLTRQVKQMEESERKENENEDRRDANRLLRAVEECAGSHHCSHFTKERVISKVETFLRFQLTHADMMSDLDSDLDSESHDNSPNYESSTLDFSDLSSGSSNSSSL